MVAAKSWECGGPFALHQDRSWSPVNSPTFLDQSSLSSATAVAPPVTLPVSATSRPSSSSSVSLSVDIPCASSASSSRPPSTRTSASIRPADSAAVDIKTPSPVSLKPHPDSFNINNASNINIPSHSNLAPLYHQRQQQHNTRPNTNNPAHLALPSFDAAPAHSSGALGLHFGYGHAQQQPRQPLPADQATSYLGRVNMNMMNMNMDMDIDMRMNVEDMDMDMDVELEGQDTAARKARALGKPKIKNELYKTEICRSFVENNGYCKYGTKCQFAHGDRERRPVRRHPRYKTKLCRNFATGGNCPYGTRCRFIHETDLGELADYNNNTNGLNFVLTHGDNTNNSTHGGVMLQLGNGTTTTSSESPSTGSPDIDINPAQMQDMFSGRTKNVPAGNLGNNNNIAHNGGKKSGTSPPRTRLPVFQTLSAGLDTTTAASAPGALI